MNTKEILTNKINADYANEQVRIDIFKTVMGLLETKWKDKKINKRIVADVKALLNDEKAIVSLIGWNNTISQRHDIQIWNTRGIDHNDRMSISIECPENNRCYAQPAIDRQDQRSRFLNSETFNSLCTAIELAKQNLLRIDSITDFGGDGNCVRYHTKDMLKDLI